MKQTRRGFLARAAVAAAVATRAGTAEASEEDTVKAEYPTPTFEAMAADCAARGCSLERDYNVYYLAHVYLHGRWDAYQASTDDPFHLHAVDAWRRSLHA